MRFLAPGAKDVGVIAGLFRRHLTASMYSFRSSRVKLTLHADVSQPSGDHSVLYLPGLSHPHIVRGAEPLVRPSLEGTGREARQR